MEYTLENEHLKIKINSLGAELKSAVNKKNNIEYLWQADPKYWNRTSPILFPNVGKYFEGKYRYNGVFYEQKQHGFARDKEFVLLRKTDNFISLGLRSDSNSKQVYPFDFELILSYLLRDNEIVVSYEVRNTGNDNMYFQIGGHPGFNVPLYEGKRSDNYIYFPNKSSIVSSKISLTGYMSKEKEKIILDDGYLKISDNLFVNDALVLEEQGINEVSICDFYKKPFITLKMNCPLFGIWSSSSDSPFVCIEPWYGRCDADGYKGTLQEREFENKLSKNEKFYANYTIVFN